MRHLTPFALSALLAGCSSAGSQSGSTAQPIELGSRWRTPLADGIYDGVDSLDSPVHVRLWSAGTKQLFDFAWETDAQASCTGSVDVSASGSQTQLLGDSCTYSVASTEGGGIQLTDSASNAYTATPRPSSALVRTYGAPKGARIDILANDATGVTFDLTAADGTKLFSGTKAWGDPASWDIGGTFVPSYFAPFSARFTLDSGCPMGFFPQLYKGKYVVTIWSADKSACAPDGVENLYEP